MGGSLLIAGLEMLGDATNPEYRLGRGSDFGQGDPDQATITSIYLDGEVLQGKRSHNRQMRIPLTILNVNGKSLAVNVDTLLQRVYQETFEVQWTPDGGLPVIFDAYRATVSRPRDLLRDLQGITGLDLAFPALPFGRSPSPQSVTAATGSTQLDSYATAPTGAALDTSVKFEGTGSARVTLAGTSGFGGGHTYKTSTPVARTYGSAKDLSADAAVTQRLRFVAPSPATVTATLTLLSAAGNATITATVPFKANATGWKLMSFPLTGDLGSLDSTAVTGYSLTLATTLVASTSSTASFWVDDQRAAPSSSALLTTTHAANLLLPSTVGSARAPANMALVASGGAFTQFLLHSPPGDQDPDAQILTALNSSLTDQTVTIPAAGANLRGTFSLVLGGTGTDGLDATVEITVTQKENGTAIGTIWDETHAFPGTGLFGRLFAFSEITLPLFDTPDDNTLTSYDIRVHITSGGNRYSELMLLDTKGQTIYTDGISLPGTVLYVDEPSSLQSGPGVFVSASDRTAAFSKLIECVLSGGPILLDPGVNKMLAWVDAGTPSVTASYFPRWLDERVS